MAWTAINFYTLRIVTKKILMQRDFCVFIFVSNKSSTSWRELNITALGTLGVRKRDFPRRTHVSTTTYAKANRRHFEYSLYNQRSSFRANHGSAYKTTLPSSTKIFPFCRRITVFSDKLYMPSLAEGLTIPDWKRFQNWRTNNGTDYKAIHFSDTDY